jgi:putative membrane protein
MTSATGGALPSGDRSFVEKATIGGMTEVQASELARDKASSPSVKDFGTKMIADHTKAGEELGKIAAAKGVTTPGTLDSSHKKDVDKLAEKSGSDFDKAFMKQMVSDHKTVVSLFEKEAKSGKDADLQAFAVKTLPTLRGHLTMAQTVNDGLK